MAPRADKLPTLQESLARRSAAKAAAINNLVEGHNAGLRENQSDLVVAIGIANQAVAKLDFDQAKRAIEVAAQQLAERQHMLEWSQILAQAEIGLNSQEISATSSKTHPKERTKKRSKIKKAAKVPAKHTEQEGHGLNKTKFLDQFPHLPQYFEGKADTDKTLGSSDFYGILKHTNSDFDPEKNKQDRAKAAVTIAQLKTAWAKEVGLKLKPRQRLTLEQALDLSRYIHNKHGAYSIAYPETPTQPQKKGAN